MCSSVAGLRLVLAAFVSGLMVKKKNNVPINQMEER